MGGPDCRSCGVRYGVKNLNVGEVHYTSSVREQVDEVETQLPADEIPCCTSTKPDDEILSRCVVLASNGRDAILEGDFCPCCENQSCECLGPKLLARSTFSEVHRRSIASGNDWIDDLHDVPLHYTAIR